MGGGKPMLMFTSTPAMAGTGTASINAKSIVPKSNFITVSFLYLRARTVSGRGSTYTQVLVTPLSLLPQNFVKRSFHFVLDARFHGIYSGL
jgi:hypothetical protein